MSRHEVPNARIDQNIFKRTANQTKKINIENKIHRGGFCF